MAYGVKALRRLQLGRETTAGTIVAATTVWRGEGVIEDTLVHETPVEDIGLLPDTTRSYIPLKGAKIALAATPATFEQLPHILEMGIATVTGTSDGTGTDWVRTYTMPTSSSPVSYTHLTLPTNREV